MNSTAGSGNSNPKPLPCGCDASRGVLQLEVESMLTLPDGQGGQVKIWFVLFQCGNCKALVNGRFEVRPIEKPLIHRV